MSAEATSSTGDGPSAGPPRPGPVVRPVVGVLADGSPFYAALGEVSVSGPRVMCHLCGRLFRSVSAHLRAHGWTKVQYAEAFGLERGQSLEGPETRKLRSVAFTARLVFDPAIRAGSAAGRRRARAGDLTRDAASAAQGRRFPEQRRRKAAQARAAVPPSVIAQVSRERADRNLAAVASRAARQLGFSDPGAFVLARAQAGRSMAEISREAGLHKDWLSRHLRRVDPAAAAAAARLLRHRPDAAWLPALRRAGYSDVPSYLRDRNIEQHQTVHAIAAEVGVSPHAVDSALRRHGLARTTHAAKRHAARERAARVADGLGYQSIADYISDRRDGGWTGTAMSVESGQPLSWLRRHATDR
jgi:AraC-like DNA-binding protein